MVCASERFPWLGLPPNLCSSDAAYLATDASACLASAQGTHLCCITAMVYKRARICCEAAHGAADVLVNLCHLLVALWHLQWRQAMLVLCPASLPFLGDVMT